MGLDLSSRLSKPRSRCYDFQKVRLSIIVMNAIDEVRSCSVYHTIHMLPWLLWTIDALLLAQEVNHRHLNSAADEYDVLAALSTSNTRRTYNCEVLEFAGKQGKMSHLARH